MTYLYNRRGVYYLLKGYSKTNNIMFLEDPHTEQTFELHNARDVIKLTGYKVVKRSDSQETQN